jgi:hypothetical protein
MALVIKVPQRIFIIHCIDCTFLERGNLLQGLRLEDLCEVGAWLFGLFAILGLRVVVGERGSGLRKDRVFALVS